MNGLLLRAMVLNEVRLRMRRWTTVMTILAVIALTWIMISNPATGHTVMAVEGARLLYNSEGLALGASLLGSVLFGIAGFYLVRGRVQEDVRYGAAGILASTPVTNAEFVFGRWLGAVAYLGTLILVFLAAMLVLHALRGEGPIQLTVYLQDFALILFPAVFLAASVAILSESWGPLMGKTGDILYFILWLKLIDASASATRLRSVGWLLSTLHDFTGIEITTIGFERIFHTSNFLIGFGNFNPSLAPVILGGGFWSAQMVLIRIGCALTGMLPLIPSFFLFHRFSPDRIKVATDRRRRSLLGLANHLSRPLTRITCPLFYLAARMPVLAGQVLAEVALALASNPLAILAGLLALLTGMVVSHAALGGALFVAVSCWGVIICGISVRDFEAGMEGISAAVIGGVAQRYLRQFLATLLLGMVFTASIALRWVLEEPMRLVVLVTGLFALSAAASLLGRSSRTARTYLALFLFGLYISSQMTNLPALDVVGANGAANVHSVVAQLAVGLVLLAIGVIYNRSRED